MTDRPSPAAALAIYAYCLLVAVGLPFVSLLAPGIFTQNAATAYFAQMVFEVLALGLPVAVFYDRNRALRPAARMRGLSPVQAVLIMLSAAVGAIALNMLITYWAFLLEALGIPMQQSGLLAPQTSSDLALSLLSGAVFAGFFEELFFRGMLLPALEPWGRRRAVWISGLLFALVHVDAYGLPAQWAVGVLVGMLVIDTGSLPAAMLYHTAHNATLLMAAYSLRNAVFSDQGGELTASLLLSALPTVLLLTGLWAFLFMAAQRRGAARLQDPLPTAARKPWPRKATVLLAVSLLIVAAIFALTYSGL